MWNSPVSVEEAHARNRAEKFELAQGPAGPVQTLLRQLDGGETVAGQSFQRGEHGAAQKCLTQLGLIHKREVLKQTGSTESSKVVCIRWVGLI